MEFVEGVSEFLGKFNDIKVERVRKLIIHIYIYIYILI